MSNRRRNLFILAFVALLIVASGIVVATKTAIREMVKLLQEKKGITEVQAYQAASMAADLRITELVDGNVGVHMMIAKSYLETPKKP